MPRLPEHPYDGIAQELSKWMTSEIDYHVQAMQGNYRTPFSAQTTEKEKHEYFTRQMYNVKPDGTVQYDQPNQAGRDKLLKTLGVQQYAQIYEETKPKAKDLQISPPRELAQMGDTAQVPGMPVMPEDQQPLEPAPQPPVSMIPPGSAPV